MVPVVTAAVVPAAVPPPAAVLQLALVNVERHVDERLGQGDGIGAARDGDLEIENRISLSSY